MKSMAEEEKEPNEYETFSKYRQNYAMTRKADELIVGDSAEKRASGRGLLAKVLKEIYGDEAVVPEKEEEREEALVRLKEATHSNSFNYLKANLQRIVEQTEAEKVLKAVPRCIPASEDDEIKKLHKEYASAYQMNELVKNGDERAQDIINHGSEEVYLEEMKKMYIEKGKKNLKGLKDKEIEELAKIIPGLGLRSGSVNQKVMIESREKFANKVLPDRVKKAEKALREKVGESNYESYARNAIKATAQMLIEGKKEEEAIGFMP